MSDRDFVGSRICRFHQNVFGAPTASTGVFWRPYRLHRAFFVLLPPSSGDFIAPTASTVSFRANTSRKNAPVDPRKADPRKPPVEPPPPPSPQALPTSDTSPPRRRRSESDRPAPLGHGRHCLSAVPAPTALPQGAAADAGSARPATLGRSRRALPSSAPGAASGGEHPGCLIRCQRQPRPGAKVLAASGSEHPGCLIRAPAAAQARRQGARCLWGRASWLGRRCADGQARGPGPAPSPVAPSRESPSPPP